MKDVDRHLVQLLDKHDAYHFRPGPRHPMVAYPEWSTRGMCIVDAVDVEAGTVTLRSATRWERARFRLSFPLRWLRWRLAK